ncbi:MAG: hypothetical protein B7Z51_02275 [Methyloversatilis sp. 12-65-5]|nr:MAG: hypothetical protein B7Z51_02275 [Methyloversatilis sp. 12-65-5]
MILPPATLGMLGGGELGRFFVLAAHEMGYRVVVLDPDRNSPETTLLFDWDDLPVELAVFPAGLERSRGRERLRAESLRALLDNEEIEE